MKYPIHEDLKILENHKMPAKRRLLPVMNTVLKMYQCKSEFGITVTPYTIPGYEGELIKLYVIEPEESKGKLPCFVLFHGGGFMLKASGSHYAIAKEYAREVPCKVVYADYRVAPKNPFPIPVEDCYAAYQWTLEHAEELAVDTDKIIIGGDSAGGCLAAAVTLMARDRGQKMPSGAMLIYPVMDRRMMTESMKKYTDTPVWDANLSKMMWDCYLDGRTPEQIEYASPAEAEHVEGFPKTYLEVAEYDALKDEGLAFGEKLKAAHIPVEIYEIKGACHGFETAIDSSITRTCIKQRMEWLKKQQRE